MGCNTKIELITEESQNMVDEFLSFYASSRTYMGMLRKLPSLTDIYDFRKLTYANYEELEKDFKDTQAYHGCIQSFFHYLYLKDFLENEQGFLVNFQSKEKYKEEFDRKRKKLDKDVNVESIEFAPALSFSEIEKLMKYEEMVHESQDYQGILNLKRGYMFHVLFYDGMTRDEAIKIDVKDYSNGLLITQDKEYIVPEKYYSLFEYFINRGGNAKFSTLNILIKQLGAMVGIENLVPRQITDARGENMFKCSQCGQSYLSFADNWKAVNGKIICKQCAEILSEEDEKKNKVSSVDEIIIETVSYDEKNRIEKSISTYEVLKGRIKQPCNFDEWNKYLEEIGNLGEKYVYKYEVNRLLEAGREDLAEQIDETIANDHTNGYDILSFTTGGEKIHIEVKTTPGPEDAPFYISRNEIDVADAFRSKGEIYKIYRVFNIGSDNIEIAVYDDLSQFNLEEIAYKATKRNGII